MPLQCTGNADYYHYHTVEDEHGGMLGREFNEGGMIVLPPPYPFPPQGVTFD